MFLGNTLNHRLNELFLRLFLFRDINYLYLLHFLVVEVVQFVVFQGLLFTHLVLVAFLKKDEIDLLQNTTDGGILSQALRGGFTNRLYYWRAVYWIDWLNVFEVQIGKSLKVDAPLFQSLNEVTADQFRLLHLDAAIQLIVYVL